MGLDSTVEGFYTKNAEEGYAAEYDRAHGPRLDALLKHPILSNLKGQKIADIGGGLGFLGKRLDPSNDYWVFDGAECPEDNKVAKGTWVPCDIQRDSFGHPSALTYGKIIPRFDIAFCLEVVEHLSDPYHCFVEIKRLVKPNGLIVISIPTEKVWHNVVYCGLLWPSQNFEQFLDQMALPRLAAWKYEPEWQAYHWITRNAAWTESKMLYPKAEPKFRGKTPLEMTNL